MDVKIGVQDNPRELSIDTELSPEEVESAVAASLADGSVLRLLDRKGTVVLVPATRLAYVEIGAPRKGGVGFGKL